MSDVVERLEEIETNSENAHIAHVCGKAAETIEALRAENEKLRAILFQFAAYNESVGNVEMFTMTVPAGVIRAAAAALKGDGG